MVDLEADVTFPARADDWMETLVIGTLLTLFSVFLLPILPVYGYFLHTARAAMAGVDEPIPFTEWETLFVDGLKGLVVMFLYQLPPLLVGILSFVALIGLGSGNDTLAGASVLVFLLGLLAASVLGVVFGYLGVVAVLTFASEDRLGAAFDPGLVKSAALDGEFAVQWLYGVALLVGANVLFSVVLFALNVVMIIPIIGLIIALLALLVVGPAGAAFTFYTQVAVFNVWGRGYGDARGLAAADVPDWAGRDSGASAAPDVSESPPLAAAETSPTDSTNQAGSDAESSADGDSASTDADREAVDPDSESPEPDRESPNPDSKSTDEHDDRSA
ncbi:MAG: DUF4013 domain-containing protein [Haloferacaceae archaeon]